MFAANTVDDDCALLCLSEQAVYPASRLSKYPDDHPWPGNTDWLPGCGTEIIPIVPNEETGFSASSYNWKRKLQLEA